jgi:hypothetical protein
VGYSQDDWLRDQGLLPGINLHKIRFGHRVERRKPLEVSFMGQRVAGKEKPQERSTKREARIEDEGYAKFQLRLW